MTESDVVVVSAPLGDHTRGMIGGPELEALGPDGVLINVGRGPLVQEQPLYDALASHRIAGAAIDVWYSYPDAGGHGAPSALPFRDLPNVLMTPHSSGVTDTRSSAASATSPTTSAGWTRGGRSCAPVAEDRRSLATFYIGVPI